MRARIDQFDGLRAIAFLAVFVRHTLHVRCAQFGVDLFFVLSGFLITQNLVGMRESATTISSFKVFFYHRVLRIMPPYYLVLVVFIATGFLPLLESPYYFGFVSNIRDSVMAPIDGPAVTMWSICIEEQFYLIWPFIVLILPRRWLPQILIAIIVAAPLVRFGFRDNADAVYRLMITRMDLLAVGALIGVVDLARPTWFADHRGRVIAVGLAALTAFVACELAFPLFEDSPHRTSFLMFGLVGYSLVAIMCGVFLILVRIDTSILRRVLCNPILRYIGKVSYVAYLIHLAIITLLLRVPMPGVVRMALALAATIAFASASWYLVEKPISRFRNRVKLTPA